MSARAPVHPEVLLSLADEIRQTIAWLGDQEDPPADQLAYRLRTLREAATVAGLQSVGSILTGLDAELTGVKKPHTKIELVLKRLSSAILSMANSLENKQLEWVERALGIERMLDRVAGELAQGTDRLAGSVSLLETSVVAPSDEDRRHLLLKLAEDVRLEIARQRHLCDQLHESIAALRTGTRRLTGDLSGLLSVPLLPTLIKLREYMRALGRDLGKPVSLHPRCTGVEVNAGQIEPLGRLIDHLVKEAFQEGIEKPQQRRVGGKPTVGVLRVTAAAGEKSPADRH